MAMPTVFTEPDEGDDGKDLPFEYPYEVHTVNKAEHTIVYLSAYSDHFLKVSAGLDNRNNHRDFYYFLKDDNDNSKQIMLKEACSYLVSGSKVSVTESGTTYWFVRLPSDFIINESIQSTSDKEVAETWNIGGDYSIGSAGHSDVVRGHLPKRVWEYAKEFTRERRRYSPIITAYDVRTDWYKKLKNLT